MKFRGVMALRIIADVSGGTGRAATDDGVDDHPFGRLGWLLVFGKGDLAGAAAMGSTAVERECLLGTDGHDVASSLNVVDSRSLLAWEIAPIGQKRGVVERGHAVRLRRVQRHVRVGSVGKGHGSCHEGGFC